MTLDYDFYIEEHDLEVTLKCTITSENNGIGSYEYMGHREYDSGEDCPVVEEMEWDKSLYTEYQNSIIQEEINKNWENISENVLDKFDPMDYM